MTSKSGRSIYLQAVTMIDPATGWIERHTLPSARDDLVANQVELSCLTHYSLPNKVIAKFRELITNDYGTTIKPITPKNSQTYAISERVHQTIGNILRTFKVQNMVLDDENPWDGILASTMFALRAMIHTITQYTPTQLIYGRDTIMN